MAGLNCSTEEDLQDMIQYNTVPKGTQGYPRVLYVAVLFCTRVLRHDV